MPQAPRPNSIHKLMNRRGELSCWLYEDLEWILLDRPWSAAGVGCTADTWTGGRQMNDGSFMLLRIRLISSADLQKREEAKEAAAHAATGGVSGAGANSKRRRKRKVGGEVLEVVGLDMHTGESLSCSNRADATGVEFPLGGIAHAAAATSVAAGSAMSGVIFALLLSRLQVRQLPQSQAGKIATVGAGTKKDTQKDIALACCSRELHFVDEEDENRTSLPPWWSRVQQQQRACERAKSASTRMNSAFRRITMKNKEKRVRRASQDLIMMLTPVGSGGRHVQANSESMGVQYPRPAQAIEEKTKVEVAATRAILHRPSAMLMMQEGALEQLNERLEQAKREARDALKKKQMATMEEEKSSDSLDSSDSDSETKKAKQVVKLTQPKEKQTEFLTPGLSRRRPTMDRFSGGRSISRSGGAIQRDATTAIGRAAAARKSSKAQTIGAKFGARKVSRVGPSGGLLKVPETKHLVPAALKNAPKKAEKGGTSERLMQLGSGWYGRGANMVYYGVDPFPFANNFSKEDQAKAEEDEESESSCDDERSHNSSATAAPTRSTASTSSTHARADLSSVAKTALKSSVTADHWVQVTNPIHLSEWRATAAAARRSDTLVPCPVSWLRLLDGNRFRLLGLSKLVGLRAHVRVGELLQRPVDALLLHYQSVQLRLMMDRNSKLSLWCYRHDEWQLLSVPWSQYGTGLFNGTWVGGRVIGSRYLLLQISATPGPTGGGAQNVQINATDLHTGEAVECGDESLRRCDTARYGRTTSTITTTGAGAGPATSKRNARKQNVVAAEAGVIADRSLLVTTQLLRTPGIGHQAAVVDACAAGATTLPMGRLPTDVQTVLSRYEAGLTPLDKGLRHIVARLRVHSQGDSPAQWQRQQQQRRQDDSSDDDSSEDEGAVASAGPVSKVVMTMLLPIAEVNVLVSRTYDEANGNRSSQMKPRLVPLPGTVAGKSGWYRYGTMPLVAQYHVQDDSHASIANHRHANASRTADAATTGSGSASGSGSVGGSGSEFELLAPPIDVHTWLRFHNHELRGSYLELARIAKERAAAGREDDGIFIYQQALARLPKKREYAADRATVLMNLSVLFYSAEEYKRALAQQQQSLRLLVKLLQLETHLEHTAAKAQAEAAAAAAAEAAAAAGGGEGGTEDGSHQSPDQPHHHDAKKMWRRLRLLVSLLTHHTSDEHEQGVERAPETYNRDESGRNRRHKLGAGGDTTAAVKNGTAAGSGKPTSKGGSEGKSGKSGGRYMGELQQSANTVLDLLSNSLVKLCDHAKAIKYQKQALELAVDFGDMEGQLHHCNNLGVLNTMVASGEPRRQRKEMTQAREEEAARIKRAREEERAKVNDAEGRGLMLRNWATEVADKAKEAKEAKETKEALADAEGRPKRMSEAERAAQRAKVAAAKEEEHEKQLAFIDARLYLERAMNLAENLLTSSRATLAEEGDTIERRKGMVTDFASYQALTAAKLGDLHFQQGMRQSAISSYRRAQEWMAENSMHRARAHVLSHLSLCLLESADAVVHKFTEDLRLAAEAAEQVHASSTAGAGSVTKAGAAAAQQIMRQPVPSGVLALQQERHDEALECMQQSLALCRHHATGARDDDVSTSDLVLRFVGAGGLHELSLLLHISIGMSVCLFISAPHLPSAHINLCVCLVVFYCIPNRSFVCWKRRTLVTLASGCCGTRSQQRQRRFTSGHVCEWRL
jgi:tetratricopeptide (TPR) repeat protein